MTAVRPATRLALTALAAVLVAGCGVRPTGVLDGGQAPGGLTKGMRMYFVSPTGRLEAVPRPDLTADDLAYPAVVIKELTMGPSKVERAAGLVSLVRDDPYFRFEAVYEGDTVAVTVPDDELSPTEPRDRNLMGQLVCTFARARAVTDGRETKRTDDIRVTLRARAGQVGPYVCSDFLD
ncbi:hypothetical protein [Streptomyces sp. NPDC058953]|uniref:hypothetical protein n=1 Tax=unclassified Streptomyces TaxID=2593676 RepID=UPI0036BA9601